MPMFASTAGKSGGEYYTLQEVSETHQWKILDASTTRKDIAHFGRPVDNRAIAANSYNIAVSSYMEQEDTREAMDITALNAEISRIMTRQTELCTAIDAIVHGTGRHGTGRCLIVESS